MTRHVLLPSWAAPLDDVALLDDATCLNGAAPLDGTAPTDNTALSTTPPGVRLVGAARHNGSTMPPILTVLPVSMGPPILTAPPLSTASPLLTTPPILTAPPVLTPSPSLRKPHLSSAPPHLTMHPPPTTRPQGVASSRGSVFVRERLHQGASLSGSGERRRRGVTSSSRGGSPS